MPAIINPTFLGNKPPYGTPINWRHPLTRGLVASYLFNEGQGRCIHDGVQGFDLNWQNTTDPTWFGTVPDLKSQTSADAIMHPQMGGVKFTGGATDYFTSADAAPYRALARLTGHFSVEVWIWFDTDPSANPVPVSFGAVNTDGFIIPLKVGAGATATFRVGVSNDANDANAYPTPPMQRWQHFVGTFDVGAAPVGGTTGQVAIYRDGILRNLGATATMPAPTVSLRIGNSSGGANQFGGYIAVMRLWDRMLHPDEVLELFQDPFGMVTPEPHTQFIPGVIFVNVFDNINPTDAIAIQPAGVGLSKSVFDTITVTDAVTLAQLMQINVFDTATPADVLTVSPIAMKINVFDSVPIIENISMDSAFIHMWNDIVALSEPFVHMWDVISDITEMFLPHQWNVVGVIDSITHSWRVLPQQLQTLFNANVQWITSIIDWSIRKVSVADDIPVQESVTIRGPSFGAQVFDNINVTESVTMRMHRFIQVFDQATPAEDVDLFLPLKINVFDNVNPTDVLTTAPLVIPINVFDTATPTESVTVTHS